MVFMEESELSSKRWASAPRRSDSPCVLGAPTSREAAGPPVQLEPVDLSVKTPVVLQVPRYSPAAALITAARRIPSPSTTPTPPPLCASTDAETKSPSRIIGGSTAHFKKTPWQSGVLVNDFFTCGGAIISERHVLTAAHCVFQNSTGKALTNISVIVGSNEVYGAERHDVESIIVHPEFIEVYPHPHDIAVIKLATEISFNENKSAVALPASDVPVNEKANLTGWGLTSWRVPPKYLKTLDLTIITNRDCDAIKVDKSARARLKELYNAPLTSGQICGMPSKGSGGSRGDSGGALVFNGSVVGIFSWVYRPLTFPDVFTRVYEYVDWIREVMRQ